MATGMKVEIRVTNSALEKNKPHTADHAVHQQQGVSSATVVQSSSEGRCKSASAGHRFLQDQSKQL